MKEEKRTSGAFFASPPGRRLKKQTMKFIRRSWPDIAGKNILLIGETVPFAAEIEAENPSYTAEYQITPSDAVIVLPYSNRSFSFVFICALSRVFTETAPLLREVHRILAPQGQVILLNKNKSLIWRSAEPDAAVFSAAEIRKHFSETYFDIYRQSGALYSASAGKIAGTADDWAASLNLKGGYFLLTGAVKKPFVFQKADIREAYKSARMTRASILSSPRS